MKKLKKVKPTTTTGIDFGKLDKAAQNLAEQKSVADTLARLKHYQSKSDQLQAKVNALMAERGKLNIYESDLVKAVEALEPYPRVKFQSGDPSRSPVAPVLKLSDWQIGEVILGSETDGFGEFNWDIAQARVAQLTAKVIDWVEMHRRGGFSVPEMHIFSEADIVSGNIHYELEVTNEFPAPEATAKAGMLLGETFSKLAAHFDKLVVWEESADNHGRLTKKNQFKQGARNNFSYLAHQIANMYVRNHKNIEIHEGDGMSILANVLGKKFLIKHGHTVKSQLGMPFYGIDREKGREAVRRMGTDKNFDYMSIGHWHVPGMINGILINGNLPGTTELDHGLGRSSDPSQVSFFVHPKWGVFDWTAWKFKPKGE
jgi:hypothetical protein